MQVIKQHVILLLIAVITSFVHGLSVSNYEQSKQDINVTGRILPSTECDCGPKGVCRFEFGEKKCFCEVGFQVNDGKCKECDCGPKGICIFEYGFKKCNCKDGFQVKYGMCEECDCGFKGNCSFKYGLKKCNCEVGFQEKNDMCTECDCGPNGICSFEYGKKKCECKYGFIMKNGKCTECDCGPNGNCSFEHDEKKCYCKHGFQMKNGMCTECDCGLRGMCSFEYDEKKCYCAVGFQEKNGTCREICHADSECLNGGRCNLQTNLCECKPYIVGDKCKIITGCDSLDCENHDATCDYDIDKQTPTCVCDVHSYYYENGTCNHPWCTDGCNLTISKCEYMSGVGICKCNDVTKYYDYSSNTCRSIDPCFMMQCGMGEICRNGVCECDDNHRKYDGICRRKELCKNVECFPLSKCEENYILGNVKCLCDSRSNFYHRGKCQDGSCFLPGQRLYCEKACPAQMFRKNGECRHIDEENECHKDCGFLGWCYEFSNGSQKCICDPNYAELDRSKEKCVLKTSAVCPLRVQTGNACYCRGKYKLAKNGITCELKSCSDEDVQLECKSKRAMKCVDGWKNDVGYKCVCASGYTYDSERGCIDPCSKDTRKRYCSGLGQKCYIRNNDTGDCRCPPTFRYISSTKSCESISGNTTFMIRNLPVLKEKYVITDNHINEVLLNSDVIISMMRTFNNLSFAHILNFRFERNLILCDVWLQFIYDLPARINANWEVQRWKHQVMRIRNRVILPPVLLLDDYRLSSVTEENLSLCSNSVFQSVCGTGSICSNNKCDCAPGFRVIESTVRVSGSSLILRCEDIDECLENIHACSANTDCINTQGDYFCQCKPGYKKADKWSLVDKKPCVDLCDRNPCVNGACRSLRDSIYCECKEGYSGSLCTIKIDGKKVTGSGSSTHFSTTIGILIGITIFLSFLIILLSVAFCRAYYRKEKS